MGMRYAFDHSEGDIKLSGVLAEICVERGYFNIDENTCSLSWLQVQRIEQEMSKRESDNDACGNEYQRIDRFKKEVLTTWLATHNWGDKMVFS